MIVSLGAMLLTVSPLSFVPQVVVAQDAVRLGEVANLDELPEGLRIRAGEVVVARVREGETVLPSRQLAARARAQLPALGAWLPADRIDGHVRVMRSQAPAPAEPAARVSILSVAPISVRIEAGDTMMVSARVGSVEVQRQVTALQRGWAGRRVFVRTPEGEVLSVRLGDRP